MSEMDSPVGDVLELRSGDSLVEITTVGAHLRRFQVARREVIVPFGEELPWGAHGAVLAPWPNRIDAGTYSWAGKEYRLPITEPERDTAIHGLVMTEPWQAAQVAPGQAEFTVELAASAGYPFPLRLSVTYTLTGADLTVDFCAENRGGSAAPFGVGFHPWLAAGPGGLETATLAADVGTWFRSDSRLLPVAEEQVPHEFDFRGGKPLGDLRLDDAFGRPRFDESGRSWVHLRGNDGATASAWMREPLRVWQLCSAPSPAPRPGLAVEPMTCPANAFRTGDRLHELAPGASWQVQWGLTLA